MSRADILIVEDDPVSATCLQQCLQQAGYGVSSAVPSGEAALARLEQHRPDLVLMDIVLAGEMDGVETARRIGMRFDVPVIYLTSSMDRDLFERAKITSPFGYLLKPMERDKLVISIEIALHKAEMDRQVRRSELRYRSLFEDSPVAMWEEDFSGVKARLDRLKSDGATDFHAFFSDHPEEIRRCAASVRILDINKAALELFDARSIDDFRGDITSFFTDRAPDIFKATLLAAADGETRFQREYVGKTMTGERKDLRLKWSIAPGSEDSLDKVIVTLIDITDQKQAERVLQKAHDDLEEQVALRTAELVAANAHLHEEIKERNRAETALRKSEANLRHIYNRSPVLMHSIDENGAIRNVNEKWLQTMGYDRAEVIGREVMDFMTVESGHRALLEVLPRLWREGMVRNIPYDFKKKSGDIMEALLDCDAARDASGRRISLSVIRDMTDQNRAQKQVWEAKRLLRTVVDGISDPLVMVDRAMTVRMLNEAALRYYSLSDYGEAIGRPCFSAFKGMERVCEECIVVPAAENAKAATFERKGLLDPERIEQVAFYPVQEAADGLPGGIIRISDVTQKKKVDEQMIRADRLSSLGQLSAGIAHEIRNPLSGIRLFADILADPDKFQQTDTEREVLGDITENIDKIEGIIKRVLDFARHADADLNEIDVNRLIEDALRLWRSRMRKNGVRLTLDLAKNLHPLTGDRIAIQQVMNNLIQNAVEAMDGGGELKIATAGTLSRFQRRRRVILISIQDGGPGVPAEAKNKVFDPFFTTKRTGTGLGLSICHQIVERHGGFITFENRPGEGAVFWVELPVEQ